MRKFKRKKRRLKPLGIIFILIVLALFAGGIYYGTMKYQEKREAASKAALIKGINSHYNEYVKTNKDAIIYDKDDNKIGVIGKDMELTLKALTIDENSTKFPIKDMEDTYIGYQDVDKIDKITKTYSDRYKKYIPFNENIKTKDKTSFYDEDKNLVYTFNKSFDLPIIIKDSDKYGVEYQERLLYVMKDDVKETHSNKNTDKHNSSGVGVLNYHFVYDETDSKERSECNEEICVSKSQFKSHLDYFNKNNIWPIKMNELEMYMDGKLQLPKSVLITFDDGGWTKHAVDLLTEYKMHATIFLITSWFSPKDYYKTEYIELHSHSHNLHNGGKCSGGQGAPIKCLPKEDILNDLKKSREALGGSTAFCYPFYEYNSYSENLVKEAGFTMAFIGEVTASYGPYKLAEPGGNKMQIPRFVVVNYTTISELNRCFNAIK